MAYNGIDRFLVMSTYHLKKQHRSKKLYLRPGLQNRQSLPFPDILPEHSKNDDIFSDLIFSIKNKVFYTVLIYIIRNKRCRSCRFNRQFC